MSGYPPPSGRQGPYLPAGGAPYAQQTGAPHPQQTGAPYTQQTGAPHPSQTGAPYPSQTGAPYPSQTGAPHPQQTGAPYPSQTGAPYPSQTGAPYAQQTGAPHPQQTGAPYPSQTGAPYAQQTGAPHPQQTGAPYPSQTGAPYTQQTGAPHPHQTGAPYPPPAQYPQPTGQYPPQAGAQHVHLSGAAPDQAAPAYLDKPRGYENITFGGGAVSPPVRSVPTAPPAELPAINMRRNELTQEEVKDALVAFVAQHCCYGRAPISAMRITGVAPASTLKYTLDTFTEKRETMWKFEPSTGTSVITAGVAPLPWEVPLAPKQLFKDEEHTMEVPHTQSLRPCDNCQAHGDVRCKHCAGRGQDTCRLCGGNGARLGDQCSRCGGRGTNECTWCDGRGMTKCETCEGQRHLKYFVELKVTWEGHRDAYVVKTSDLPDDEVIKVSGVTVCQSEGVYVWPLDGFPDQKIAASSQHLVRKHQTGWPMSRILRQRQDVQLIPVHRVTYRYNDESGSFFVCGNERQVYFPDYPSQCCGCCCTIL